jgi:hypothetical protein
MVPDKENKTQYAEIVVIVIAVIVLFIVTVIPGIVVSTHYNTDSDEETKRGTRYTWLTWLETLDRVVGIVKFLLVIITLHHVSTRVKEAFQSSWEKVPNSYIGRMTSALLGDDNPLLQSKEKNIGNMDLINMFATMAASK